MRIVGTHRGWTSPAVTIVAFALDQLPQRRGSSGCVECLGSRHDVEDVALLVVIHDEQRCTRQDCCFRCSRLAADLVQVPPTVADLSEALLARQEQDGVAEGTDYLAPTKDGTLDEPEM